MKRINKEKDARDLALGVVAEQMKKLERLKELAQTTELMHIANAIVTATGAEMYGAPSIGDKCLAFAPYLTGLHRWSDPKLVCLLNALRDLDPNEQSVKEYPDSHNNDYHFVWQFEDDYCIRVSVVAYENAATSECRRVQVGVKMVEQPVYRYDCAVPEGSSGELPAPVLQLEAL